MSSTSFGKIDSNFLRVVICAMLDWVLYRLMGIRVKIRRKGVASRGCVGKYTKKCGEEQQNWWGELGEMREQSGRTGDPWYR